MEKSQVRTRSSMIFFLKWQRFNDIEIFLSGTSGILPDQTSFSKTFPADMIFPYKANIPEYSPGVL
jgi:hypothetical protein